MPKFRFALAAALRRLADRIEPPLDARRVYYVADFAPDQVQESSDGGGGPFATVHCHGSAPELAKAMNALEDEYARRARRSR